MNLKLSFTKLFCLFLFFTLAACAGKPAVLTTPVDPAVSSPDDLDAVIRATSDYLNGRLPKGIKLVFLNFQSSWPDLSEYVIDGLIENTVNDGIFTVVDRQNLSLIQQEMNFQLSGEVSDESAQAIGKLLGAQTIVSGAVSQLGGSYRLRVRAIEVETAEIQGQFNHDISADSRIAALTVNSGDQASLAAGSPQNTVPQSGPTAQTGVPTSNPAASPSPSTAAPTNRGASLSYERFTALRQLDSRNSGIAVFTPDSKSILAYDRSGNQGYIKLWDAETGKEIRTIRDSVRFSHIAISPDGRMFITDPEMTGNKILLWDLVSGAYRECTGHSSRVTSLAFSPDGNFFISGSRDKTIKIWDAETGQEIKTLTGHTGTGSIGEVLSVAYSPDGRQIVSCSNDKTVKFWDAESGNVVRSVSANCTIVAYCPDGRKIAAVEGNRIHIFDTQNGRELFTLTGHRAVIRTIAFSPDGSRLLSLDQGGGDNIIIWNMSNGWEAGRLASSGSGNQPIGSLMISPDGKYFAIGRDGSSITIWGET